MWYSKKIWIVNMWKIRTTTTQHYIHLCGQTDHSTSNTVHFSLSVRNNIFYFKNKYYRNNNQHGSVCPYGRYYLDSMEYYYSDLNNNQTAMQSSIINITLSVASLFAPADRSSCTTSACPWLAAHMRGVDWSYKIVRDNSLYNNEKKKKNMNFHAARSS